MPRQRSSVGRAPARPTLSKPAATPSAQQSRPAATYAPAAPPAPTAAPSAAAAPTSSGPGLFGQMASTAAGVAIGSSIGHAIGGMFTGGGNSTESSALDASPQAAAATSAPAAYNAQAQAGNCGPAVQQFTKCMDEHGGNMQICNWYLDQLKACQAAAAPY
ncbi:Mitochondrial intermembrane space cysteine motif-containing protein MIC17 [Ceratocystis lukuohia]|uniref:Mitochondrial intermembrane space cysteine motif-containing protein MIC17 n=3 Tax=Ceratocystis TaxID=5157 RepID=A0A0F8CS71_CERFI|nr:Mitochondrial intermembrane space cysteine motif-containing protein MIC17 [Ceratocystis platani]PHH50540.1 Mitochondrial intermembrane space cysteine motif-containing protein MIX17 [Ceratocystis fimbriata CBS 114723]